MIKTWTEEAREEGLKQGIEKGTRKVVLDQLEVKFSPLSEEARQRLAAWPAEKLTELSRALLTAQSLRELGLED